MSNMLKTNTVLKAAGLKMTVVIAIALLSATTVMTGCAKHENAEGKGAFRTEEIAAKQGELARNATPAPDAKEPARFVASAPAATTKAATPEASSATATTSSTATTHKVEAVTHTAASSVQKTK